MALHSCITPVFYNLNILLERKRDEPQLRGSTGKKNFWSSVKTGKVKELNKGNGSVCQFGV